MKKPLSEPHWLRMARSRWPEGLDSKWSPYWIKKFLGYLEMRNQGRLPDFPPEYGIAESFCRFIGQEREVEDWKIEQARNAIHWLLGMRVKVRVAEIWRTLLFSRIAERQVPKFRGRR